MGGLTIRQCPQCAKYTLKQDCCQSTVTIVPARYSPQKNAKYRQMARKE
ncbi:MAG: nucleolar RNA-binding Nop10p family protein [Candidatus Woesearchaeota archaeon]|jgi:rRNA maturation protein Nop10|nr:nucleolar RNA-binding Nop10p family protein [Candidatus Woesearchaeota archaeon]MDP7181832.1 nucleolar RNA-binding Nop10p family protein [Candidatus Woesearchaeota archaeon]MDP7199008.1 nucleolar RNA-binding Nop10p family protein [Candidatus Woesearchaeota archaeon]MDP7467738.1 nucleolar RNA-binding Nop10p family protein [Candidatus Woesearchaeota archaeon]MDP7646822.1 nucleolar RNA-binding Nop10p family protein [Candidatus Woesearchaeota archaeon]